MLNDYNINNFYMNVIIIIVYFEVKLKVLKVYLLPEKIVIFLILVNGKKTPLKIILFTIY